MNKFTIVAAVLSLVASASAEYFITEDVGAWHFHTYFFEVNPRMVKEAQDFRDASRAMLKTEQMKECALNQIFVGWDGPHPVSQWEMCCNATSYAAAHAWHTQNHGNLSVLIHPLTTHDQEDHLSRRSWIGNPVVLDEECTCLFPVLPKPRPCPQYPAYTDTIPADASTVVYEIPLPGTEDYGMRNKNFNILSDKY